MPPRIFLFPVLLLVAACRPPEPAAEAPVPLGPRALASEPGRIQGGIEAPRPDRAIEPLAVDQRPIEPSMVTPESSSLAEFDEPIRTGPMARQSLPAYVDGELADERAFQLTLPTASHPNWDILRRSRVWIDEPTQLFRASHPAAVKQLAGRRITLRGYMLPLEPDLRTAHFLISPYTPVCFFHPPAEPNEVVEVRLSRPIEAGYHLVEVTGVLRLADNGEKGLFFQLDEASARIVERVDV